MARSVEARTRMRQEGVYTEGNMLPAGVQARRVPGWMPAGPKSSIKPIGGPRGIRQYPIKHACLRQYPIEQDFRGRDALPYRFNAARELAGARSRVLRRRHRERER